MAGFEMRDMGFKVPATIYPVNHDFPVADANDVAGNIMFFEDASELYDIPYSKRKLGMFVYIQNEGVHYRLVNNKAVIDADCWVKYELVSKDYVDNAIIAALAAGNTNIDITPFARKTDLDSLATKTELAEAVDGVIKAKIESFDYVETLSPNAEFTIEVDGKTVPVQLIVNVETNDNSQYSGEPTGLETKEFTISQSNIPFTTEWELPTTGPVTLNVLKEVNVEEVQETNSVEFNSANAGLFDIQGGADALVTIDDNGLRMKDCYVDSPINLQQFAGGSNGSPVQGQPFEWDSQMIVSTCKFNLTGINIANFGGLSVTGSVGSNNFIGVVFRDASATGDFGPGISYDFTENKWMVNYSDNYNVASWPTKQRIENGYGDKVIFDTDFMTTMINHKTTVQYPDYSTLMYVKERAIPLDKIKNIPASKWQELFGISNTTFDMSTNSEYYHHNSNGSWPVLDPANTEIAFVFAAGDYTQPCRVTKIAMKNLSTSTQNVPAINPDDFTYNIQTKTGKSAVRFEWSGWQIDMTGRIFCENRYYPISSN